MPNKITAEEAAKEIERFANEFDSATNPINYSGKTIKAMRFAASILRKVAAGDLLEGALKSVHAHWEEVEPGHDVLFRCSKCGRIVSTSWGSCEDEDTHGYNGCDPTEEWLSCPTCGSRMDEMEDNDAQIH